MAFTYPTNHELEAIAQDKLPVLTMDDPIFSMFPIKTKDVASISWEQKDNYFGLQQLRGLGGSPSRVYRVGGKRYTYEPGYYGEYTNVDEKELTERRKWGSFNEAVDISDLVMECQDELLQRRIDRLRYIGWTLLGTGAFTISMPNGSTGHSDTYTGGTYNIQTSTGTDWSNPATSTPMADLRAIQLLARGHSVSFGPQSTMYMNQTTVNYALANTNSADLGGRRVEAGNTINDLPGINKILLANGLPQLAVYDEGYFPETTPGVAGTFTLFIPNRKGILVGKRPGNQPVGEYWMTRNANNANMAPGAYQKVVDKGEREVPRVIEVHDGHNGGPVIFYPSAVVLASF